MGEVTGKAIMGTRGGDKGRIMIQAKAGKKWTKIGTGHNGLSSKVGNIWREQTCPGIQCCFQEEPEVCGKEKGTKNGPLREI
jgi:hypothetical protein